METFSALLAICAGNSVVSGEFPAQRPVTRSFDVFFDLPWINAWNAIDNNILCFNSEFMISQRYIRETKLSVTWWRHQRETFSALLACCAGNSPVTAEFPAQRPVTRSFGVFFDLRLHQELSKQWIRRWFKTPLRSLWRYCNELSWSLYAADSYVCTAGDFVMWSRHVPNIRLMFFW